MGIAQGTVKPSDEYYEAVTSGEGEALYMKAQDTTIQNLKQGEQNGD
jgi:hypothetical protein